MTLFPEHADAEFDWEGLQDTHEIMYVVKRSAYELYLDVPRAPTSPPHPGQSPVLLRVKAQGQPRSVILKVGQLEDVFDGMQRLLEYPGTGEAKRRTQL